MGVPGPRAREKQRSCRPARYARIRSSDSKHTPPGTNKKQNELLPWLGKQPSKLGADEASSKRSLESLRSPVGIDSAPDVERPRGIWGSIRGGVNLRGHCWATPYRVRVATHPSCFGSPVRILGDSCDGNGEVDESGCDTAQEVLGRGGRGHCPGLQEWSTALGSGAGLGAQTGAWAQKGTRWQERSWNPLFPGDSGPCRSGTPGAPPCPGPTLHSLVLPSPHSCP